MLPWGWAGPSLPDMLLDTESNWQPSESMVELCIGYASWLGEIKLLSGSDCSICACVPMADAGEGVMLTAGGMSIVADKGWVNVSVMGGTHGGALGIGSRVAVVSVAEAAAGTEPGSMAGGVLTDLGMVTLEVVTLTEVEAKGGTEEIEAAVDAAWGNGVVA